MPREAQAAPEGAPAFDRAEVERQIDALVEERRVECLWYLRPDYRPGTDAERVSVLEAIQARSGNEVFKRAGILKAWLSRLSSDASVSS